MSESSRWVGSHNHGNLECNIECNTLNVIREWSMVRASYVDQMQLLE